MTLRLPAGLLAFALLAGCASVPVPTATVPADDNLNAVAWSQTAIEHDLIYLQTYRDAQSQLLTALNDPHWDALATTDRVAPLAQLPPAVVLDIDETVLDNSPYAARLVRSETFAPILYVIAYDTLDEAVAIQNSVPYGLSSAVFTDRLQVAERFLSADGSDCGIANVNLGTSGAEIGGAFGGEKETGGGRESGSDAWKAYMRRATNTVNYSTALPLAQGVTFDID